MRASREYELHKSLALDYNSAMKRLKSYIYSIDLPGAGKYKISYADGPKKGQVIKIVTVTGVAKKRMQMAVSDY